MNIRPKQNDIPPLEIGDTTPDTLLKKIIQSKCWILPLVGGFKANITFKIGKGK